MIRKKYAGALNPRIYRGYNIVRTAGPIVVCELLVTAVAVYVVLYFDVTRANIGI